MTSTMFKKLKLATFLLSAFGVLLLAGCGDYTGHQSALDPKGPLAKQQYDTFILSLEITIFLTITVGGALLYAIIRFRERPGDENKPLPKQSHGNPLIEGGLIVASAIILVILAIPTLKGIRLLKELPEEYQEDAITINVKGFQWWFEFEYPDLGINTANEFVFPVGKAVKINLTSHDVIHSFWLPKLSGKTDLIPGQKNFMWIYTDEEGEYYGQCAEYCGDSHAYMLFRGIAKSQKDYDAWVQNMLEAPKKLADNSVIEEPNFRELAQKGEETFNRVGCLECHKVGEVGGVIAPNLSKLATRGTLAAAWIDNNTENLKKWIWKSETVKPGNLMYKRVQEMKLTESDVDAIVAYLQTLK
jgi:cytochrome c oxidase subunit 2